MTQLEILHMPAILAVTDAAESAVCLHLNGLVDTLVLQLFEALICVLLLLNGMAFVQKLRRPKQGAQMLRSKWRVVWCRHSDE